MQMREYIYAGEEQGYIDCTSAGGREFEKMLKHKARPTNRVTEDDRRVQAAKAKRENRRLRNLKLENGYE